MIDEDNISPENEEFLDKISAHYKNQESERAYLVKFLNDRKQEKSFKEIHNDYQADLRRSIIRKIIWVVIGIIVITAGITTLIIKCPWCSDQKKPLQPIVTKSFDLIIFSPYEETRASNIAKSILNVFGDSVTHFKFTLTNTTHYKYKYYLSKDSSEKVLIEQIKFSKIMDHNVASNINDRFFESYKYIYDTPKKKLSDILFNNEVAIVDSSKIIVFLVGKVEFSKNKFIDFSKLQNANNIIVFSNLESSTDININREIDTLRIKYNVPIFKLY